MIDFTPVREKKTTLNQITAKLTCNDLRNLTNEMIDAMLALIANATDEDVMFVPDDPNANDTFAQNADEVNISWTLGHVIVHATASSEESAFLAAELARGVPFTPRRSRVEVPWQTITTVAQCRERLEESRRMRLATLDVWSQHPHLENTYTTERYPFPINPIVRFVFGLQHDDVHLGQIQECVRQSQGPRTKQPA